MVRSSLVRGAGLIGDDHYLIEDAGKGAHVTNAVQKAAGAQAIRDSAGSLIAMLRHCHGEHPAVGPSDNHSVSGSTTA